jgi:hypothetical protein
MEFTAETYRAYDRSFELQNSLITTEIPSNTPLKNNAAKETQK